MEPSRGSGKPRKTTQAMDYLMRKTVRNDRDTTVVGVRTLLQLDNISEKTIFCRRIIETDELQSYWKILEPFISEINRIRRVQLATEHLHWTVKQWRRFFGNKMNLLIFYGSVEKYGFGEEGMSGTKPSSQEPQWSMISKAMFGVAFLQMELSIYV